MAAAPPPRRSRTFRRLLLVAAVLLALPGFVWCAQPRSHWHARILDKTVPHPDYREHGALVWALNHGHAPAPDGLFWRASRDYVGYHPASGRSRHGSGETLGDAALKGADILFVTDTYGVYEADQSGRDSMQTGLDYSRKLYGGLTEEEADVITRFAAGGGAVVAEFNTFASPTVRPAREKMERLLGLRWSDWSGRYFANLADEGEVPVWARRNWKRHHGSDWAFQGPGYMFVNEDSRIEVLREGPEVTARGLRITSTPGQDPLLKGVSGDVPFSYWFDIVSPEPTTTVLATYVLDVTPAGSELLIKAGIPSRFPAVLRASGTPLRLYWAGDFSDNELMRGPWWYAAWPPVRRAFGFDDADADQGAFFWTFYNPFVQNLLHSR